MKLQSLFISLGILIFVGCQNDHEPVVVKEEFTLKSLELIEQTDAFGWELFKTMNGEADEGKNLVISPLSITQCFGMAINGATGENLEEMLDVFGHDNTNGMNEAYKNIRGALSTADPKVTLGIANSAWYRQDFAIKAPFFEALSQYYEAKITGLDFSDEAGSKKAMNDWVNLNTKRKIPTIIDEITDDNILFLINAVYFYGNWSNKFDVAKTTDAPFYLSDGSNVQVKMMEREWDYEIANGENFTALRAPYTNGSFAMTILLPDEGIAAVDVVNGLNTEVWNQIRTTQPTRKMKFFLPRFKTACSYDLIPSLQTLGMNLAFSDNTGFHNIAEAPIVISEVKHKTFIEVDEKGTEAAAVTSIGFELTSMPPQATEFRVDRPFVFVISEKASGAVLFAGKIENPLLAE
jgi:serpin B